MFFVGADINAFLDTIVCAGVVVAVVASSFVAVVIAFTKAASVVLISGPVPGDVGFVDVGSAIITGLGVAIVVIFVVTVVIASIEAGADIGSAPCSTAISSVPALG